MVHQLVLGGHTHEKLPKAKATKMETIKCLKKQKGECSQSNKKFDKDS